eukprot:symbB.v1.2.026027.t1/scaffold2570.1/size76156/1
MACNCPQCSLTTACDRKTYRVKLERQVDGSPLGLIIAQHPRVDGLVISAVRESEAIQQWNVAHPETPIHPGLAVLDINAVTDSEGMVWECCNAKSLNMVVSQQLTPEQSLAYRKGLRKHLLSEAVDEIIKEVENVEGPCDDTCAICHEEMRIHKGPESTDAVVRIPCGHHFHRGCVKRWLVSGSQRCPLCNQNVELAVPSDA